MRVYYVIDQENKIYGVYDSATAAVLRATRCGGSAREAMLFISDSISLSEVENWDLYRIEAADRELLVRAPDWANAAADAALYLREERPAASIASICEYTVYEDMLGGDIESEPSKINLTPPAIELLSVLTAENRDLVAHLLSTVEEIADKESLRRLETSMHSPAFPTDWWEPYTCFEDQTCHSIRNASFGAWFSASFYESLPTREEIAYLKSCDSMTDPDELLFATAVLAERYGYDCAFPYALFCRLTDGRLDRFCKDYKERVRKIFK